jgi:hypothetical protein
LAAGDRCLMDKILERLISHGVNGVNGFDFYRCPR